MICNLLLTPVGGSALLSALLRVTTNTTLVPALTPCPCWQEQDRVLGSPPEWDSCCLARHSSHGQEAKHFCCIWGSGETSCCLCFSSSAEISMAPSLHLLAGKVFPAPEQLGAPLSSNSRGN